MTPAEMGLIVQAIELAEKHPPKVESWERGHGQGTLAEQLRSWLKERL